MRSSISNSVGISWIRTRDRDLTDEGVSIPSRLRVSDAPQRARIVLAAKSSPLDLVTLTNSPGDFPICRYPESLNRARSLGGILTSKLQQHVVVTHNPSSIEPGQTLQVRFPNLGENNVIAPGSFFCMLCAESQR